MINQLIAQEKKVQTPPEIFIVCDSKGVESASKNISSAAL